jgi:cytochrome c peroxidase
VRSQITLRNTPTLANVAFSTSLTFDGRESILERQALIPLLSTEEMDMTGPEIEARLAADTMYVRLFRQAFGEGAISLPQVVKALATYQRTLISYRSPYDFWQAGDTAALSPSEKRGANLFFGEKGGCVRCHVPPLFTDGKFHNTGLDSAPVDLGRARVTSLAADEGKFKTPTLRNLTVTNPYMHDGRIPMLEDVVAHYNSGGFPHPNRDSLMQPLGLDEYEVLDLVNFLQSLTDPHLFLEPQL